MKTWHLEVVPAVEARLTEILAYISGEPLFNPDAAFSVFEDFEQTLRMVELTGDRIPIGSHPIMRKRELRRINFQEHRYFLIYRIKDDTAQIVRIGHFLEDLDKVLQ